MIVSGARSTGSAGRDFTVAWSFVSADVSTANLQAELEGEDDEEGSVVEKN